MGRGRGQELRGSAAEWKDKAALAARQLVQSCSCNWVGFGCNWFVTNCNWSVELQLRGTVHLLYRMHLVAFKPRRIYMYVHTHIYIYIHTHI